MKRILTAIVLIAVVLGLVFFGQLWMITLFAAIVAELAAYEYLQLANNTRLPADQSRIPTWWMAASTSLLFLATLPNWPLEAQFPLLSALTIILFA